MFVCPDHGAVTIKDVLACPTCNKTVTITNDAFTAVLFNALTRELRTKLALRHDQKITGMTPKTIEALKGAEIYMLFRIEVETDSGDDASSASSPETD